MKHETLMLGGLFAACLLVCASVLGSMLIARPAANHALATTSAACATTATTCPLPRG
ncbi:hypothetical protein [Rhodanobacter sp. DHB23]|uniref:hypothetical protein n=1 Tax=Rhodanobacter sp. DHB23 TaxID=2775923 RepID=UPI0017814882|nr:hypothetical protein [Rhodanobacter sp. DHB23]MBD8872631.1 hypothetical protein [Rhodanobacter sp. DHB23]